MVDWVSFGISLTALLISSATALVGLIITWVNHRKSFDPIIVLNVEENEKLSKWEVCVKNIGRGVAYLVNIDVYLSKKNVYEKYYFFL